jgi:hypothetical protein
MLVGRLTRPVLGKRGFAGVDVIAHWPAIVGPEMAALACPLALKYERDRQRGATLQVRVASGAAATLLQLKTPQIVLRINRYFGYEAVARLQATVGPLPKAAAAQRAAPPPSAEICAEVDRTVAAVSSPALRIALGQLGVALRQRTAREEGEAP